jgi:ABC-type lipoprotein export system ATPase subunit
MPFGEERRHDLHHKISALDDGAGYERDRGASFILVIGASGSGKSSLLKAGVLAQLARRRGQWMVLPLRPVNSAEVSNAAMVSLGWPAP